jgi:hypothetical protein
MLALQRILFDGGGIGEDVAAVGDLRIGLLRAAGEIAEVAVEPRELAVAGEVERCLPRRGEASPAPGGAQLLGAELGAADVARGLPGRAGDGERGDERALVLGSPAVGAGAARHRLEFEQVGDGGEAFVAGDAGRAALVADDGDGRERPIGIGGAVGVGGGAGIGAAHRKGCIR